MKVTLALGVLLVAAPALAQSTPEKIDLGHIDVTNVDTSVSPCDNFFQYACGKVDAANPIPPDQISWGPASMLRMWNQQQLYSILEANEAANPARTPDQQKIGDFYQSCVQQANSGANDVAVLKPLVARIEAIKSRRDFAETLAAVQMAYSALWTSNDNQTDTALFGYGPAPDANNVSRVVGELDQAGLGLPSRGYYLGTASRMVAIRERYRRLIETDLTMDGMTPDAAKAAASTILRMETEMAQGQMDNITRRDPNKTNNRYTLAEIKQLMPNFDWDTYFAAVGAPAVPLYEVSAPEYFKTINKMLATEDMGTWKVYLRWQLLHSASPVLGNKWRDANFELAKLLSGARQQQPTWLRCTTRTDASLGNALGQLYVKQTFPPESRARVLKMVKDIEAAMGRDIDNAAWMQPATKQQAKLKLAAIVEKIGYPDKWIDYSSLTISRGKFPENVSRANEFELRRQLRFIGKPIDRMEWTMTPPTVNAYEDPQTNTINFPAGILQPPFFDAKADDVVNYGAEGAVLGHELTHDFDDQGRKFDLNGNLKDWWTAADAKAYDQRGACIAAEYSKPVPNLDVVQNGKLTQGEDTADNGGLYLALSALTRDLQKQGKSLSDKDAHGLTDMQRFFLSFANDWCGETRPEAERAQVLTNPHSVRELRVNNTVGNMPEFANAFGCKAGQPMVHKPACRVW